MAKKQVKSKKSVHKMFLEELNRENVTGVAYKNVNLKKTIILILPTMVMAPSESCAKNWH
jgi:hypothetical protein